MTPFFSRRIGLNERGEPQPINFGGKLTGQAGAFDIGVLQVQTREDGPAYGEDFTVMRVKRRLLRQSSLGAIYTRRAARGGPVDDRHTAGFDFQLATSSFLGSDNLDFHGSLLKTPIRAAGGTRSRPELELTRRSVSPRGFREVQGSTTPRLAYAPSDSATPTRRSFSPRPTQHTWIRRSNSGRYDRFVDPITSRSRRANRLTCWRSETLAGLSDRHGPE